MLGIFITQLSVLLSSSLHWIISLSFCSFLYNGVCNDGLKLSVDDVAVIKKGNNGDRKLQFSGQDYKNTNHSSLYLQEAYQ